MNFYIRCTAVCLASVGVLLLGPGLAANGQSAEAGNPSAEAASSTPVASLEHAKTILR